jgi:hypothetical protein
LCRFLGGYSISVILVGWQSVEVVFREHEPAVHERVCRKARRGSF